ncbi:MAG: class I SAM-dependent methyltransferase [Planctomycetota bacterium]
MPANTFDQLADVYEAMIDWPKRLAAEEPFYRRWFQQAGVKRVVDVACGTGHHADMFHRWGLDVEGADLSPAMIEKARANFDEPPGLHWAVRGFDEPIPAAGSWDAVVCVGNSLALAPDLATVQTAVARMLEALRPGGVLLVQILNLWRLPDGPCIWQKCLRTQLPQGDVLILKGVHRCGSCGYVELAVADPNGGPLLAHESPQFLGLESSDLEAMAQQAGSAQVQFFGGYAEQPFDRDTSVDLVMVAFLPFWTVL